MLKKQYIKIEKSLYSPVKIDDLIVETTLPFDIFVEDDGIIRNLFGKGSLFTSKTKTLLKDKGISEVLISDFDTALLEDYLSKRSLNKEKEVEFDFKDYSLQKERYFQIEKNILHKGSKLNFSLYTFDKSVFREIFVASEEEPSELVLDLKDIKGDIYIKINDIGLYDSYINSLLQKKGSSAIKMLAIKEHSKVLVKEILDNPRSGEKIKEVNGVVNTMINSIIENQDAIYDLLSLRCYDYYTYTHSVNVCAFSVGMGVAINLEREDIEKLGIGSMLHDIGKSAIPHEILNKQGKLSDREYKIMKNHVLEGEKILRSHENIPEESFYAVLQHHEKLSGKGYPLGLTGKDIRLFGKITAIADCYDALTTQRPYKKAFTPYLALSIIVKETGDYDPDLLKTFIKMLGKVK